MKVQGVEIGQDVINACLARMKLTPYFGTYQIASVAERAGVKGYGVADRLADRLIQRERKSGNIVRVRMKWRHNEAPEAL